MPRSTIKAAPRGTGIVSIAIIVALLVFLIWAWVTLAATAATSSNDMGLMLLKMLGAFGALWLVGPLMLVCAFFAFRESSKESRKEIRDDSQVSRFVIIGLAFVAAAIMLLLFGALVPAFIMLT
jgi:hypothetical protein